MLVLAREEEHPAETSVLPRRPHDFGEMLRRRRVGATAEAWARLPIVPRWGPLAGELAQVLEVKGVEDILQVLAQEALELVSFGGDPGLLCSARGVLPMPGFPQKEVLRLQEAFAAHCKGDVVRKA